MKICFLLQRRFAYIGYALAENLYQKYGVKKFCGYVQVRQSYNFLKNQKSPSFNGLLLDEEIHNGYKTETIDWQFIKTLEENYGLPNLWPYIELDRIVRSGQLIRAYPYDIPPYSHEDMVKIIQVTAKAILKFLDEEKPDAIVFSVVGSISSLLLFEIAKKRKIKNLVIQNSRLNLKYTLSENYLNLSYLEDLFEKLQTGEISLPQDGAAAGSYLEKFRQKPTPYTLVDLPKFRPINRRRQFGFLSPGKLLQSASWRLKMIYRYFKNPYRNDYSNINPFWEAWDNFKKKARVLVGFDNLYDQAKIEENFVFFPLHYEPEISTLLLAPFFKDQLWLIKQIARSLPFNFKLYVKEHTSMVGYRARGFYKELKKIPNLKLINPSYESLALIKAAKLITTISGTAGWEAVQLKKPVIVFGHVFFGRLPMVKKCDTIEQLPYLIKDQLENFKHDEAALVNLLAAIYHESVEVDLIQIWEVEAAGQLETKKNQLQPLADLIAKKLGLEPLN